MGRPVGHASVPERAPSQFQVHACDDLLVWPRMRALSRGPILSISAGHSPQSSLPSKRVDHRWVFFAWSGEAAVGPQILAGDPLALRAGEQADEVGHVGGLPDASESGQRGGTGDGLR